MHRALKPGGMVCTQVSIHGLCICLWTRAALYHLESCCTHLPAESFPSASKKALQGIRHNPDVYWLCVQGESLWLHLDIIKSLAAMCHEVFVGGTVQYAYTTIPTYPR